MLFAAEKEGWMDITWRRWAFSLLSFLLRGISGWL
jgi:hypothetical protein